MVATPGSDTPRYTAQGYSRRAFLRALVLGSNAMLLGACQEKAAATSPTPSAPRRRPLDRESPRGAAGSGRGVSW